MKSSKHFWRSLFFFLLIAALCGGLALPAVSAPARAAPQMQTATNIVISEFRTRGATASDEFIELYNPTNNVIDISGWTLKRSSGCGTTTATLQTIPSNTLLYPGQHYLSAGSSYAGTVTPDYRHNTDWSIADNGGVAVLDSNAVIIDQAGMCATTTYREGNVLTPMAGTSDQSYERKLGGASDSCEDTGDNSADFQLLSSSSPQNSSAPLSLCGVPIFPEDLTATASAITSTASAVNATGTASALTSTASAVNATDTAVALTGTNTPTSTATATATNTSPAQAASVVISEFRTRGPRGANDEFIELYNPTTTVVDISNWKINASNDTAGTGTRATIPPSTILRSGQYYLVANTTSTDGYNNPNVPPNLAYGQGITDNGGIALLRADNTIVDQVGMSTGSAYKEGTTLSPLAGNSDQSYERKPGGESDSCQDTNNNADDFSRRSPSNPQNYASQLSRCGTLLPIPVATTTTITADGPDPSIVNGSVTVSVTVTGGAPIPSGTVNITGANTNCTISLSAAGTGSCSVVFTSTGTKSLVATYVGDNLHLGSADTESHQVTSTAAAARTPTRVPTPIPPPPLIAINEFVPRPGHDWNLDGVINVGDEYIELLNHGVIEVDLSGYSLDDEVNIGSAPFRLPSITLKPGERRVFYGSETGLHLSDGGDGVRLLKPNGQLGDAYNYFVVRYPDQSYCRLPDNGGADDWNENCFPTPGLQNSLRGSSVNLPVAGDSTDLCPIADTLPDDFVFAECLLFGNNIWNRAYWDRFGWFGERYLPESPGKWPVFVD